MRDHPGDVSVGVGWVCPHPAVVGHLDKLRPRRIIRWQHRLSDVPPHEVHGCHPHLNGVGPDRETDVLAVVRAHRADDTTVSQEAVGQKERERLGSGIGSTPVSCDPGVLTRRRSEI